MKGDVLLLLIVAAQVALALPIFLVRRKQKAHQNQLADAARGKRFWRIGLARPEHLRTLWKLDALQARGVLIDDGDRLRIQGRWGTKGEPFDTSVAKDPGQVRWLGNPTPRGGNRSWAALNTSSGELMFTMDTAPTLATSREALADVFRSVFPGHVLTPAETSDFALEKNRSSVLAMVALFGLGLYALLDTYVFSKFELIDAQLVQLLLRPLFLPLAGAGVVGVALLLHRGLRAGKVPPSEAVVLSAMVAAAAAGAALPVLKRVDQTMAARPAQDYRYRVIDTRVQLDPVDTQLELPRLLFSKAPEYWAQFAVGSEVTIPLLRGPLGLWQLDHARFDPAVLAFYERLEAQPAR
jgi:hypothetical protein